MTDSEQQDYWEIAVRILAFFVIGVGILVIIVFLAKLSGKYTILPTTEGIQLEDSAQSGDFIGGWVGTIWSLAGFLLFYSALRIQSKEFRLQRKELENQRNEFAITRITNTINHQMSLLNEKVSKLQFNETGLNPRERSIVDSISGNMIRVFKGPEVLSVFGIIHEKFSLIEGDVADNEEYRNDVFERLESFFQNREVADHLVFFNDALNLCISLIEQLEVSDSKRYILPENHRLSLFMQLKGNLLFIEHHRYFDAVDRMYYLQQYFMKIEDDLEGLSRFDSRYQHRLEILENILNNLHKVYERSVSIDLQQVEK